MYKCLRCGYSSLYKNDIKKHLQKKIQCKPILSNISREDCSKILNSKDTFMIDIFMNEIKTLKEKNMTNNGINITNNGNHNNNTINNNIHITINAFENTDYTVIKDEIHKCIKNGKLDETKFIKLLHFNKKHPQNHNVKIENKRENRVLTYNGEKFEEYGDRQDGVLDFIEETLEKTERILNNDRNVNDHHLVAVQNAPIEIDNLNISQKRQKSEKFE